MRLTDHERVALVKARYLRAPNTLEQSAIEAAVEAILTARLAAVVALTQSEPMIVSGIRRDMDRTPAARGGEIRHLPGTDGWGKSGCPGDNIVDWFDDLRAALTPEATP